MSGFFDIGSFDPHEYEKHLDRMLGGKKRKSTKAIDLDEAVAEASQGYAQLEDLLHNAQANYYGFDESPISGDEPQSISDLERAIDAATGDQWRREIEALRNEADALQNRLEMEGE